MKLKEGMTFEVVEVIYSNFEGGQFNCFCNTIAFSDIEFLINNPDHNGYFEKDEIFDQKVLCLPLGGYKPIGRLIIKKVK